MGVVGLVFGATAVTAGGWITDLAVSVSECVLNNWLV